MLKLLPKKCNRWPVHLNWLLFSINWALYALVEHPGDVIGPKNPDQSLNVTCKFVHMCVCVFVPECVCVSMGAEWQSCLDGTVVN